MFFLRIVAAVAPVAVLLGGIVWLQRRAYRAAALAWLVAVSGALALFDATPALLAYGNDSRQNGPYRTNGARGILNGDMQNDPS